MQSSRQITTTNKPTSSFLQAGCPSCRPTNSVKALKGKISYLMDLLTPNFQLCLWPLIAPCYLGEVCHASHQPSHAVPHLGRCMHNVFARWELSKSDLSPPYKYICVCTLLLYSRSFSWRQATFSIFGTRLHPAENRPERSQAIKTRSKLARVDVSLWRSVTSFDTATRRR